MSDRIQILNHEGARILLLDFSNLKGKEYARVIAEVTEYLLGLQESFDGLISDSTNAKMDNEVKNALKNMDTILKNKWGEDYQEKGRVADISLTVGLSGLAKIIARFVLRNVKPVDTREAAMDLILEHKRVKSDQ